MNTKTTNEYIGSILTLCDSGVDNKTMSDHLANIGKKCPSIYYDNSVLWFLFISGLASSVIIYYLRDSISAEYLFTGIVIAIICGLVIYNRNEKIKFLNDSLKNLYEKNLLDLKKIPIKKNLRNMFLEFGRGNYANKIEQVARSKDNSFDLIRYNWVNKYYVTETRTNKQGKTYFVDRVQYDSFYRDCISFSTGIYDNIWVQSFPIYNGGKDWTTAYERFNKNFVIKCEKEISVAKILTPSVVLHIDELSKTINNLNIEFRDNGFVLISMPSGMLQTDQKISVNDVLNIAKIFRTGKNEILEMMLKLRILLVLRNFSA